MGRGSVRPHHRSMQQGGVQRRSWVQYPDYPVSVIAGSRDMAEAKHRPVSAEARGRWRQFRRHLAAECVQINSALGNARLRSLVSAYLRPGTVAREKIA